jgi:hypothetical protein
MTKCLRILFLLLIVSTTKVHATTWDEPWADKVIKQAGSFVLCKVISNDPENGIRIVVIKTLSGKELKDTILINNFYALIICGSTGGHGAEFHTQIIDSCYFFISENLKGEYCIATPTTGFDYVSEGNVMATFRHSYHQALVPVPVYEKTMTAVFNFYHGFPYDRDYIDKFIRENLSLSPAGFGENEINRFFLQHVALELVYHLKLNINIALLLPFLNDKNNFHNQVSAARAMRASNTEENKSALLNAISDTTKRNFVRVMCLWSLSEFNPKELKIQLQKLEESASDENDGFGGNIMDPRVCTHMPSLKSALKELVGKL